MASTKFYLDLRGKAADGKGSVLIHIFHNRTMTTVSTGIRVAPNEWDGERIKSSGSETLNASLQEKKGKIDRAIALLSFDEKFDRMSAADIKARITSSKPKVSGHLVSDLFAEYLATDISEGTKDIYRATLAKVLSFGGKSLKMENIDLKWLHQFERFLSKSQGMNGRAIFLRSLRAVCNYAVHTNAIQSYPFVNFTIKQEPTRKRSVSVNLFRKFLGYPTSKSNERYRDYFLLMFYLIGINSKDLLLAKKGNICNGRLEYVREKTHKHYSIKIEPEAEELLKRYEGKDYLLEAMDHCKLYRSFAHEMNDALKTIGDVVYEPVPTDDLFAIPEMKKKIIPIIPEISTYYARHCWATFAYEADISLDIISQALGHSSGNRTTLIYVKFDQEKVDRANRTVIDFVLQGEKEV